MLKRRTLKRNGYILILIALSVNQIMFDFCTMLYELGNLLMVDEGPDEHNYSYPLLVAFAQVAQTFFGVSACLCTNVMMFVASFIVSTHKYYSVDKNFKKIATVIGIIATSMVIVNVLVLIGTLDVSYEARIKNPYTYVRFGAVFVNTAGIVFICFNFWRRGLLFRCDDDNNKWLSCLCRYCSGNSPRTYRPNLSKSPLIDLVVRISFYPLCQLVTRFPSVWLTYGYMQVNSRTTTAIATAIHSRPFQAAFVLDALLGTAGGIGFFLIFVLLQPGAKNQMWRIFGFKVADEEFENESSRASSRISNSKITNESSIVTRDDLTKEQLHEQQQLELVRGKSGSFVRDSSASSRLPSSSPSLISLSGSHQRDESTSTAPSSLSSLASRTSLGGNLVGGSLTNDRNSDVAPRRTSKAPVSFCCLDDDGIATLLEEEEEEEENYIRQQSEAEVLRASRASHFSPSLFSKQEAVEGGGIEEGAKARREGEQGSIKTEATQKSPLFFNI